MKVQCDLCREIVVAELAIDGDRIAVRCPMCKGRFLVDATVEPPPAEKAVAPAPLDGPTMTCPKCGTAQRTADACRSCGLRADRMARYTAASSGASPELVAAWTACLSRWSDPDAHEDLATLAAAHGAYAWVAGRYRDRLRDEPGNATAAQRLGALTRITEASLRAGAAGHTDGRGGGPPGHKPYKNAITILVALVLLAAAGTIYAMVSTPADTPEAAPPIPVQPRR
jgi:hypothetical protein